MDLASLSFSTIMAGFVFGVFGFYLLKEGKRLGNYWFLGIGLFQMIYPLFINGNILVWVVGCASLWLAYVKRHG